MDCLSRPSGTPRQEASTQFRGRQEAVPDLLPLTHLARGRRKRHPEDDNSQPASTGDSRMATSGDRLTRLRALDTPLPPADIVGLCFQPGSWTSTLRDNLAQIKNPVPPLEIPHSGEPNDRRCRPAQPARIRAPGSRPQPQTWPRLHSAGATQLAMLQSCLTDESCVGSPTTGRRGAMVAGRLSAARIPMRSLGSC